MPRFVNIHKSFLPVIAVFLICACHRQSYEPGTLRINLGTEPPSLDWSLSTDSTSFDVVSNLMVGLTQYTSDLRCAPACAAKWDITDGGLRYVFHLRPDVYWSDGRLVTAGDFEYSWKRLLDPRTGAQYAFFLYDIVNAFQYNTGAIKDASLVGIKAVDDCTFEVRLAHPTAYFLYLTAFCPTLPQRRDIVERWQTKWTEPEHFVCNGPFLLSKWEHEYKIELAANAGFFEGKPRLSKIKMFMIPEQSTAFALYETDQLDYIDNRSLSTPDIERCRASVEFHSVPLLRNSCLAFNVRKHPFNDMRVRRAFAMSVNREIFPRILKRGETPSACWIPIGMLGWRADSGLGFNPMKARSLLAAAGYPNGRNFPRCELLYPQREDARLLVEAIQDQLKRNLGVRINLVNQEWKVYLQTLRRNPPQLFRYSWGADYPDPETFMNLYTSHNGNNCTRWDDSSYDALVSRAASEPRPATRGNLYAAADRILCANQVPIVPLFLSGQNFMVKPWVRGMTYNALDLQFFKGVSAGGGG